MNFNLGFIGGGNMSTAIVKGIVKREAHPTSKIWVSGPHLEHLKDWAEMGTHLTTNNSEVFRNCDVVFLGVKPQFFKDAVDQCLSSSLEPSSRDVLFISMLAATSIMTLHEELQKLSPYACIKVIRIMPNTPMMVGAGACIYTPGAGVTKDQCILVEKLLSSCAICERVTEPMIDSLGVLTSCGPAFMYVIIEALADGAVKQGVPRDMALRFASQVVIGSGTMVQQTRKHPGLLKDEVCSPGGTTICGIAALENGKLRASIINAIEAAYNKVKEMKK